jgi:hypothetical protein
VVLAGRGKVKIMFGFMWRSGARVPSAAIGRALELEGLPPGIGAASSLGVVEAMHTGDERFVFPNAPR